ncbi:autotransporter outer membrane beta-barrel domain-containing protein [Helicobacter canis]|uniref:Autotransporter domain-containing protein n=1 Tax=Helicobacter canis NCTC 12740 TaxID=1357399 RepID=V8CLE9_9HELI|nr:autotransporter outer membrane beta-barrel domain-containing protein [Helicobacter canis]ETD27850.1 hypothetical protein HMPREF2087_00774 [Helicobacter canis NCTC 12740]
MRQNLAQAAAHRCALAVGCGLKCLGGGMRGLLLTPFVLALTLPVFAQESEDITNSVYSLNNKTDATAKTFIVKDVETYKSGDTEFTHKYENGELVFTGKLTFNVASGGDCVWLPCGSKITGNFEAKEINLNGTQIAAGRDGAMGVGVFNFTATDKLTANNLSLTFAATSRNSHANFKADSISMDNAKFYVNSGGHTLKFESNKDIDIKGSGSYMNLYAGSVAFGGATATFKGENLNFAGTIVLGRENDSDSWLDSALNGAKIYVEDIKGKASFGTIKSRKGHIIANGNMSIDTLEILHSAQGTAGQDISPESRLFLKDNGTYTIKNLTLKDEASSSQAWLYLIGGNNATLASEKITLGTGSYLQASSLKSLTATDITLKQNAELQGSSIHHTTTTNLTLEKNSTASFHHLTLTPGGQIIMDATNTQLVLDNQFVNGKNEAGVLELGVSIKDSHLHNGYGKPLLAITNAGSNLENIHFKAGEVKRFIDAGEIKYNFVDSNGQASMIHCDGSEKEKCQSIKDLIGIYAGNMPEVDPNNPDYTKDRYDLSAIGLKYEKVLTYNYIGIKVSSNNANNPYQIGDIRYYLYQKCGQECVEKIGSISNTATITQEVQTQLSGDGKQIYVYEYTDSSGKLNKVFCNSTDTEQCKKDNKIEDSSSSITLTQSNATQVESDIFEWLNFLSIYDKGITWTGANVLNYDLDFFLHTANQLNNTLDQLASIDRKTSTAASTRLAADIARSNRLVKLSNFNTNNASSAFAALRAKSLATLPHYAESSSVASDVSPRKNPAFLYKFSNRHDFMNNVWATAIGSTSFVKNGHSTLYGINVGYDRFIPLGESGIILGGSTSYGYGTYSADLLKNNSHNVNAGFYSRAFIANHEIDFTANYTLGVNSEDIVTRENPFLRSLGQSYGYNTHTININAHYGYIFGTSNKSLVFKPMGGLSYYAINVGELNGGDKFITANPESNITPDSSNIAIQSPPTQRHLLALMLALETRQYFSQASYWFINIGAQKDLYISNGNRENVRFVGNNSLSYRSNDGLNTHLLGTAGGEVLLGKQTFINFALGTKIGLSYKDINLTANLGVRYVF